jgi:hypothetical protein
LEITEKGKNERKTRKIIKMNKMYNTKADTDKLHVKWKEIKATFKADIINIA